MAKRSIFVEDNTDTLRTRLLAPFFPRYRTLRDLDREPEHLRTVLRNMMLSGDGRLLFVRNQKCACTLTAELLYRYSTGKTPPADIHRTNKGMFAGRYRFAKIQERLYQEPPPYRFTLVRDPERRFLSAYHNFLVDQTNRAAWKHRPALTALGHDPDRGHDWNVGVFLDYIEQTTARDPIRVDSHWRLQVHNIGYYDLTYDKIGTVENMAQDLKEIFASGGQRTFDPTPFLARKANKSTAGNISLTKDHQQRLQTIYAADYEAFGYV